MRTIHFFAPIAAAIALLTIPHTAIAQSNDASQMSAPEMQDHFDNQKTRGLDLSTSSEVGAFVKIFENEASNTPIMFTIGGFKIITDDANEFEVLCEDLTLSGNAKFQVIGLAQGDAVLAQTRAESLKAQLIADCGVSESTLVALARD